MNTEARQLKILKHFIQGIHSKLKVLWARTLVYNTVQPVLSVHARDPRYCPFNAGRCPLSTGSFYRKYEKKNWSLPIMVSA